MLDWYVNESSTLFIYLHALLYIYIYNSCPQERDATNSAKLHDVGHGDNDSVDYASDSDENSDYMDVHDEGVLHDQPISVRSEGYVSADVISVSISSVDITCS